MTLRLLAGAAELLLIVACLHLALSIYLRRTRPAWSEGLQKRRLTVLLVLALVVLGVEVTKDVLHEDSGPIDETLLHFVHHQVPSAWTGLFEAITLTASQQVMCPLAIFATLALLYIRRRTEALMLVTSLGAGAGIIYVVKLAVGRARPALWETDWYWGSSFPSGHTLAVAVFATALAVCVQRIWPAWHRVAAWIALCWIVLVGLSRLVLGVHWPSDVLAAACIGACLPLVTSVALELRRS